MASRRDSDKPTIVSALRKSCEQHGPSVAISAWDGDITYSMLEKYSLVWARFFDVQGISTGDVIIHCLSHSRWAIVAYIGILRTGAVCVPLDVDIRKEELQEIVGSTNAKMAVCDDATHSLMCSALTKVLIIEEGVSNDMLQQPSQEHDASGSKVYDSSEPDSRAVIIYTSGSSGKPKGVIQTHSALSQGLFSMAEAWGLGEQTRFLQFASYSFDVSIGEIFTTLFHGGCLCIPSTSQRMEDIASFMSAYGVTDACLTPTVLGALSPEDVPQLKQLSMGGEAATAELVKIWSQQVRLNIVYGTSETGVWDTMASQLNCESSPAVVGTPVGCRVWITDPDDVNQLRANGEEGELCIQSINIAAGYLNLDDKTNESFLSGTEWLSDESIERHGRVYRTGDLARISVDDNCSVEILGRLNNVVKINGQKVVTGEIQSRLTRKLGGKRDIAVTAVQIHGQQQLACFISDMHGAVEAQCVDCKSLHDLRAAVSELAQDGPRHMVPSICVAVTAFPRTRNGKLDMKRLSELAVHWISSDHDGADASKGSKPGRESKLFKLIHETASKVLPGMNSLGYHDITFTELGLTSIQAVTLQKKLADVLDVTVSPSQLLSSDCKISSIVDLATRNNDSDSAQNTLETLQQNIDAWRQKTLDFCKEPKGTVFLTGSTGYLGSEILKQLILDESVHEIILLVRAKTITEGLEKVRRAAELAQWWKSEYTQGLTIWLGDLALPRLGLGKFHYGQLFGTRNRPARVDAIVHNGAVVDWIASFKTLEATNVQSTCEILEGLSLSAMPPHFVYVSGGYMAPMSASPQDVVNALAKLSGYDQTKYVSEAMILQYNESAPPSLPLSLIVKPSYVIGSASQGICHPEDTLWRLIKACVWVGTYSNADAARWLTVAGADVVASVISRLTRSGFLGKSVIPKSFHCLENGTCMQTLWDEANREGLRLSGREHSEWYQLVSKDMDRRGEQHPLFPLQSWFHAGQGYLGDDWPEKESIDDLQMEVPGALRSSLRYLNAHKYFEVDVEENDGKGIGFQRSR